MVKKQKRETAKKNIRVFDSSLEELQRLSLESGKSIPRVLDEKLLPQKYIA